MKTIIRNAKQLVTCASAGGKPKRGDAMRDVGLIEDGALVIDGERIAAVGRTADILAAHTADRMIDASDKVVCPGFVDCHTHAVYAGDRLNEFEQRIAGATYMEIMAAGGGINRTVQATRAASHQDLLSQSGDRVFEMLKLGTTSVEIKTGYGLDTLNEFKLLDVIDELAHWHYTNDIIPTFLAAHAVPPEYRGRTDAYVDLVINEMLPAAAVWYRRIFPRVYTDVGRWLEPPEADPAYPFFVDVFCEDGVFSVEQSQRMWEAARGYGMGIKAHVDEFVSLGGVTAAIQAGATSVDHLDVTTAEEIAVLAASDTIGVVLPAVNFNLGSHHYANARGMIDAGAALALATDLNPGSAPCYSMPFVMAIACRYQKLLPAEALNAATINAAYAIGMGERVGSLEVGKQADVLIVDAPDYRALMYEFGSNLVNTVIKRGKII
ncbi:MAG: imidazolonepropionase [Anaerolinea sp.]|nr:imidazolonepropionase [Anaerolinea sp.]